MIATLDIGNSAAKGGLFESGELVATFRRPLSEGFAAVSTVVVEQLRTAGIERVGISSVVPEVCSAIEAGLRSAGLSDIFRVGLEASLPFEIAYETPSTLGVDRIAAAAGAASLPEVGIEDGAPIVIIDAGTAVTIDVVADGRFLGGPILAGPELLRAAVRSGTAQLPEVEMAWPSRVISKGTAEAVATGIMFGFVDAVRGTLLRVVDELGRQPTVVATGGWSELLSEKLALVGRHAPHLVLRGVAHLMDLNPVSAAL